jgi:hypothetical protein
MSKPNQMERARAARAIIEATQDEGTAMAGFMAIFHPEMDRFKVQELVNDARDNQRRRSR